MNRYKLHLLNMIILLLLFVLCTLAILRCSTVSVNCNRVVGAQNVMQVKNLTSGIDFEYVAKCVLAEAGTESEYCKRLVADCIFNQADVRDLTPTEVINAPRNFEVVSKGTIKKSIVTEDVLELVQDEYFNRTSSKVLYFRTDHYHSFGSPYKQLKNMYFSVG